MRVALVLALALASALPQVRSADEALEDARAKLEAGDAVAAEAAAREALQRSLRFVPEREMEARPDKGLLFEEMILEARQSYRARRARYFQTLGEALGAREKWREARKAYRRSYGIEPSAEILLRMADHPDLDDGERLDLLLDAYLSPDAVRASLEERLLATGAFRTRNALKASLDRRRFSELSERFADLELEPSAFPDFQAVTNAGNLKTGELLRSGARLVVYVPVATCPRCSEELDGLVTPVLHARRSGKIVDVAAFVPESDLEIARRIVRLLGMPVGVGQRRSLPASLSFYEEGELRLVARGGLTQIRLPMSPERSASAIRERVEAALGFLDAPEIPTEEEPEQASVPLVSLERGANERSTFFDWVDTLERLEAGPAPLTDLYGQLERLMLGLARGADRSFALEMLQALSGLEGANEAKAQALGALETGIGERLLEEAQRHDASIRRTAPGEEGVFDLALRDDEIALVRSFRAEQGLRHVAFGLAAREGSVEILWSLPMAERPTGVAFAEPGAVLFFEREGEDGCRGLRVVASGELAYEGCPAALVGGEIVEVVPALVDDVRNGPRLFRRNVLDGVSSSELARGLDLFTSGDFAGAAEAFEAAMSDVDPVAPYDASDLLYNRARALEEMGDRRQALELFRSLGDVAYQDVVDERASAIESGR